MHTFQIVTTDGRDLGPMALGRPRLAQRKHHQPGRPQPNLRVVEGEGQ